MKFIYPAVFKKTEDGRYKGTFPDLEGCFGEGDTLDEAIENANAAAFDWISVELSEEVPELPQWQRINREFNIAPGQFRR